MKFKRLYSLYSSESIYIILLQKKPEMEELQLHLHGAHKADCEKPVLAFRKTNYICFINHVCFINKHMIGK